MYDGITNGRKLRRAGAIAFALSVLVAAIGPATASAEQLSMEFTEARANVGASQLTDDSTLFDPPQFAAAEGLLDPETGSIEDGALTVPTFTTVIDDPPDTEVTVEFEIGTITGSYDKATGALSGTGTAGGILTADGQQCRVAANSYGPHPDKLTLSTTGNAGGDGSRVGTPFVYGLTGAGAIAGQWMDMTATPVGPGGTTVCNKVAEAIDGPGGIWLYQEGDVTPPTAPVLVRTDPASPSEDGSPRIIGNAEAGSTIDVYAGSDCTGSPLATAEAGDLASPGIAVDVAEGTTASFAATATDAAGNVSDCSAPISYTHKKPPTLDPDPDPDPDPEPAKCVVPELAGKTLRQARKLLTNADCKVGNVKKPKKRKGKKLRRPFVVKASKPGAGATPKSGKVNLMLKQKPKAKSKKKA